jgi:hypothetical protein
VRYYARVSSVGQDLAVQLEKLEKASCKKVFSLGQNRGVALLPPPALGERGHRGLARRLVAVRWRAVFAIVEGDGSPRPRPQRPVELRGELLEPSSARVRCDCGGGNREHAELPPWLPAKSARVSNLPACCALGPPACGALSGLLVERKSEF